MYVLWTCVIDMHRASHIGVDVAAVILHALRKESHCCTTQTACVLTSNYQSPRRRRHSVCTCYILTRVSGVPLCSKKSMPTGLHCSTALVWINRDALPPLRHSGF
ncbi:hypothetical protein C8Q80DRAFT_1197593 [Daedaleopsis nitida]|nr:hypothetical protein C8Q80DRAFT_1197593 [Daedaleopsis nitida]